MPTPSPKHSPAAHIDALSRSLKEALVHRDAVLLLSRESLGGGTLELRLPAEPRVEGPLGNAWTQVVAHWLDAELRLAEQPGQAAPADAASADERSGGPDPVGGEAPDAAPPFPAVAAIEPMLLAAARSVDARSGRPHDAAEQRLALMAALAQTLELPAEHAAAARFAVLFAGADELTAALAVLSPRAAELSGSVSARLAGETPPRDDDVLDAWTAEAVTAAIALTDRLAESKGRGRAGSASTAIDHLAQASRPSLSRPMIDALRSTAASLGWR